MTTHFQFKALEHEAFSALFNLSDSELIKIGAVRMTVHTKPGFPCRVSLEDAEIGEEVLLLPYQHHKTGSPYQSGGPVFIRKNVRTANLSRNEIPKMLEHRLLSLRGYDQNGMMLDARVEKGGDLRDAITQIFSNQDIAYLHIHNAKPGCYNCLVERV